ncbi:NAD-dependent nucleoside-diphosphate-sugar epimerase [Enterococcus sp. DIV1089c]
MKKVLVTGCLGQIGSELVLRLREDLGNENVIATDIRMPEKLEDGELFEILDVMDYEKMRALVEKKISSRYFDSFSSAFISCR